jgi:hypothetical protein
VPEGNEMRFSILIGAFFPVFLHMSTVAEIENPISRLPVDQMEQIATGWMT